MNRDVDMIIRVNYIVKELYLQNIERVATYDCSSQLYRQKDCVCCVVVFKFVSVVWFDRDLIIFCQCRCLISWYVNSISETFFFLLVWTFSNNETKHQRKDVLNIIMWWVHFLNILMKTSFRLSLICLVDIHLTDSSTKLCTFKSIVIFRALTCKFLKNSNRLSPWNEIL